MLKPTYIHSEVSTNGGHDIGGLRQPLRIQEEGRIESMNDPVISPNFGTNRTENRTPTKTWPEQVGREEGQPQEVAPRAARAG